MPIIGGAKYTVAHPPNQNFGCTMAHTEAPL